MLLFEKSVSISFVLEKFDFFACISTNLLLLIFEPLKFVLLKLPLLKTLLVIVTLDKSDAFMVTSEKSEESNFELFNLDRLKSELEKFDSGKSPFSYITGGRRH